MGLLKVKRDGKLVAYRLDKAAVILGSGDNCNIRVPDGGLVSRHCQILKMENGYVLRDMSGDVGTFVNGKKVKEHLLSDRDVIQAGTERFTFAISEGENTARVAVSTAAAAPAKTTARVPAAAPARSGNTGRVAAAPPAAVEPPRKTTARVPAAEPAPTARSTQRVGKGTQRMPTGGTKKITARTAQAMGYQTARSTFALPSTRKGKLIAIGGVLFILALAGILYSVKASQVNPEKEKEEMLRRVKDIDKKFKPDQVAEKDQALEDILRDWEPIKKYVAQVYADIEKIHSKVHPVAAELVKATKEVKPFLNKYAGIKAKPDDLKAQAQALYDECKSLNDSWGATTYGVKLTEILTELKAILENRGPSWTEKFPTLQRDTEKQMGKGEFAQAKKATEAFATEFKEGEQPELHTKLVELRAHIDRRAEASPKKTIDAANKLVEEKKKDEAVKLLQAAKEGLEGYPKALEKIEAALTAINK